MTDPHIPGYNVPPFPERMFTFTRLRTGDYVCISNDRRKIWRFHSYVDGKALGLECNFEHRTFWRAAWVPTELWGKCEEVREDPWNYRWIESDWYLPTRKAAIERMLVHEAL